MTFQFDNVLGVEERAMLVEMHGEIAVRNHAAFIANFHRVHSLFPRHQMTEAESKRRAERPE